MVRYGPPQGAEGFGRLHARAMRLASTAIRCLPDALVTSGHLHLMRWLSRLGCERRWAVRERQWRATHILTVRPGYEVKVMLDADDSDAGPAYTREEWNSVTQA